MRFYCTMNNVQSEIFKALEKTRLLVGDKKESRYSRCGRTDKGVSAVGQVSWYKTKQIYLCFVDLCWDCKHLWQFIHIYCWFFFSFFFLVAYLFIFSIVGQMLGRFPILSLYIVLLVVAYVLADWLMFSIITKDAGSRFPNIKATLKMLLGWKYW